MLKIRGLRKSFGSVQALRAISLFEEPAPRADFRIVHRAVFGCSGRLVYVVGPSGSGKDSVLAWARADLPRALAEFPRMEVAHVTASAESLRSRLEGRGREGAIEIAHRLARAEEFALPEGVPCFEVNNDGDLAVAGCALLECLLDQARRPAAAIAERPV